jgi:integrase
VIKAATKDKYFHENPVEDVSALANPSVALKENLEVDEYIKLLNTPCFNEDIKLGFLFCLYTGLRWVDLKALEWKDIKENVLTTRIIQKKTGRPVTLTLHPISKAILERQAARKGTSDIMPRRVFALPSANGANGVLDGWVRNAGIDKYITWSCARLSFSILLQDKHVDTATVAYLLGHTTTKQVECAYKRHRPRDQAASVSNLPMPEALPSFLKE